MDAVPPVSPAHDAGATKPAPARSISISQAIDGWDQSKRQIATLLREQKPSAAWIELLEGAAQRMVALAQRDADTALYLLFQTAFSETERYSAHHAMLCALVCEQCASWMEFPPAEVHSLVRAALTMNIAMSAMQDALTQQGGALSVAQRHDIDSHPARGAALLVDAGVTDSLWLEIVREHHNAAVALDDQPLSTARQLAQLLRRVDIYTAKLSRRATREATTPSIAARDACLDATGAPDAIGATILRMLGLYPPGSFVLLASGEVGAVIRRGAKAHTPIVAALKRADGRLCPLPVRRDTAIQQHSVLRGVTIQSINMRLHHERTLSPA